MLFRRLSFWVGWHMVSSQVIGPPGSLAVVTGASQGIGLELVKQLVGPDRNVLAVCRRVSPALAELRVEICPDTDITDPLAPERIMAHVAGRSIDTIIHNAGIFLRDEIATATADTIRRQMEVNAIAPVLISQALLPSLGTGARLATHERKGDSPGMLCARFSQRLPAFRPSLKRPILYVRGPPERFTIWSFVYLRGPLTGLSHTPSVARYAGGGAADLERGSDILRPDHHTCQAPVHHRAHATSTGWNSSRIPRLRSESNPKALVWVMNCEMFPRNTTMKNAATIHPTWARLPGSARRHTAKVISNTPDTAMMASGNGSQGGTWARNSPALTR
jgi:hypothetical protein